MVVPFLSAKKQRRKNKFSEKVMCSVLQVNGGSCERTKLRCLELRRQAETEYVEWHVVHLLRAPGAKRTVATTQGSMWGKKRRTWDDTLRGPHLQSLGRDRRLLRSSATTWAELFFLPNSYVAVPIPHTSECDCIWR